MPLQWAIIYIIQDLEETNRNYIYPYITLNQKADRPVDNLKYQNPDYEKTINWKDAFLNIKWPIKNPIVSKKDSFNTIDFREYYKSYFNNK